MFLIRVCLKNKFLLYISTKYFHFQKMWSLLKLISVYMCTIYASHALGADKEKQLRMLNPTWQPQTFIYLICTLKNNAALINSLRLSDAYMRQ